MIPYIDNGHPDAFPIHLDFSGVAVTHHYGDAVPLKGPDWMAACYWAAWELLAPIGYVRMMTPYPDVMVKGKWARPGETVRVSVVPAFHWNGEVMGTSTLQVDRNPTWWQTVGAWVAAGDWSPQQVGWAVVHELFHCLVPSAPPNNWVHNPALGTVYLAPIPPNPTVNYELATPLIGGNLANVMAGWRWDDQNRRYNLGP